MTIYKQCSELQIAFQDKIDDSDHLLLKNSLCHAMLWAALMHIDKWGVSFSLLRETVETFVTFGEIENYLQTVEESEEVAVWHSAGTDTHLVLDSWTLV